MNKYELMQKILYADDRYFNYGDSPYSDDEYDELKEQLRKIDPENPLFGMVGSNVDGMKEKLPFVMGSLNKVKPDNVDKWLEKHPGPYIVSEKLDGVSFLIEVLDGQICFAATRGNGEYGKLITKKAKIFVGNMVKKIKGMAFLRGEAMLVGDSYKKLGFKNRRNGVAGLLNQDGTKNVEYLTPFFYELIMWSEKGLNEICSLEQMIEWGLNVPHYMTSSKLSVESLEDSFHLFKSDERDMDGLVISCMNEKRENVMYPENKVAFKINVGGVNATVNYIKWSVSRTGRVIPVAVIEPVSLGGVVVENVTAHNAKFVYDNKLGKGSIIKIVRSGDVIPYILSVEKESDDFKYIENCPMCNEILELSGVDVVCKNPDCYSQKYKRVSHFLRTLGVEGLTEVTLENLGLDTIEECFEVDEYDIASVDGFGVRSGEIIVEEIENCIQNVTPEKLIAAFGIPNVSEKTAKLIVDFIREKTNDPKEIMQLVFGDYVKPSNLVKIYGIGEKTAELFWTNIRKYESLVDFLYNNGLTFEGNCDKKFKDVKFALTGKGPFNRGDIVKMIEAEGGSVGSVTKSTNYLVTSNLESTSGKMKKAKKYDINIIDYDQLMNMIRS